MTRLTILRVTVPVTLAVCIAAAQRQPPPDTEIFLGTLAVDGDGLKLATPSNISNSPGYDNQPSFTPDGSAILFTSARGAVVASTGDRAPATDVYRYDIAAGKVRQLTSTPESEYSPTVTPDGRHISVVRVESDGTQRLWRFTIDGKEPELLLRDIKPVGYHVWIDDRRLALFVLGEPATLQVADLAAGTAEVVVKDVGRSLQRIPGGGISFVRVERSASDDAARSLSIMELDRVGRTTTLIAAVKGAKEADVTWTPQGTLLMAHADTLYAWRRGQTSWTRAADLAALGLRGASRLAVSPRGGRIAIVAEPQRPGQP